MVRPYHTTLCGSVVELWTSLLWVLVDLGAEAPVGPEATAQRYSGRLATACARLRRR